MELKEIYENIQTLTELSKMDINLIERRIRAGMEGKIRKAQSDLNPAIENYKNNVIRNCAIIAVKGKFGKDFAEIAQTFKTLSVDFLAAVDYIGDSIIKRGGKDQYTSHEHLMTMDELNKIKLNYKISTLPLFQSNFKGVGSQTSIKQALYTQLTAQYGGQLYSAVTRGDIGNKALEMGFNGRTLPVILFNYVADLDPSMLPSPVEVLDINEKPTKEDVKKILMQVRSKFKSNSK